MSALSDALQKFLEEIGDEPFSIKGGHRAVVIALSDRTAMISADGEVELDERSAAPTAAAVRAPAIQATMQPAGTPAVVAATEDTHAPKFTEADVPKLLELVEVKITVALDVETGYDELDGGMQDHPNHLGLGFLGLPLLKGNLDNQAIVDSFRDISDYTERKKVQDKWRQSRFRTFKQADGEIAVEVTYFPTIFSHSDSDAEVKAVYEGTRLSEVLTFEEFLADVRAESDWTENLFAGLEIFEILFVVKEPGKSLTEEEQWIGDPYTESPLWIQRANKKYNVHILTHED